LIIKTTADLPLKLASPAAGRIAKLLKT